MVKSRGSNAGQAEQRADEAAQRDFADIDLVPHHQNHAGEPDDDAGPLARPQLLAHPAGNHDRGHQRLAGDDERRHARRHPEVLRVVAAAELNRMHEDACHHEMRPLGRRAGP